jgi:hypothetical protein
METQVICLMERGMTPSEIDSTLKMGIGTSREIMVRRWERIRKGL